MYSLSELGALKTASMRGNFTHKIKKPTGISKINGKQSGVITDFKKYSHGGAREIA